MPFITASLIGILVSAALFVTAVATTRAAGEGNSTDRRPAQREDLPADTDRRPPPLAIFDTDHDGVISADEISAASSVLRRLDRDKDGKLSGDELIPRRPPGGGARPPRERDEAP